MEERKAWLDKYFKGMVADDQNLHPGAYTCGLWIIKLGKDGMSVHLYWGGDE
jgi:hypothetical protein